MFTYMKISHFRVSYKYAVILYIYIYIYGRLTPDDRRSVLPQLQSIPGRRSVDFVKMKTNTFVTVLVAFLIVGYGAGARLATGPKANEAPVSKTVATVTGDSIDTSEKLLDFIPCAIARSRCSTRRLGSCRACVTFCTVCFNPLCRPNLVHCIGVQHLSTAFRRN